MALNPPRKVLSHHKWVSLYYQLDTRLGEIMAGALKCGPWAEHDAEEMYTLRKLHEHRHMLEISAQVHIPDWRQQHPDAPFFTLLAITAMTFEPTAALQVLELDDGYQAECRLKDIITSHYANGINPGAWPLVREQVKCNLQHMGAMPAAAASEPSKDGEADRAPDR